MVAPTRHLPKQIKVGPFTFEVTNDPKRWEKATQNMEASGVCDTEEMVIYLDPAVKDHTKRSVVLWHEIMHAVWDATCHDMDLRDLEKAEESFVAASAPVFVQVLRDNPDLVKYLI